MGETSKSLEALQSEWKQMFQQTLPQAATSKSPSQPKWPVHVDHCFARIILDQVVGIDTPWMEKIKSPAYKNMTREQLENGIQLGQKIMDGEVDLVELDERSLEVRGKTKGGGKRKRADGEKDESKKRKMTTDPDESVDGLKKSKGVDEEQENFTPWLKKIALSDKTAFQKKVLSTLCQVPRGKYTTYAAIARHLSSSARAVGNAIRNNPFAPHVPCHRVLASGGGLGGFHGSWGRNGKEGLHDEKKRKLLRDEGVKFDGKGKVVGAPWEGFT